MTYNTTRRRRFSAKQRRDFLERHGRRCYWCREPIADGQPWDIEHELARELGGSDEDDNLRPIHRKACHPAKTKADRRLIAKSNHVRRFHGIDPDERKWKSPKMKSRPFQKGPKRTWPSRKIAKRQSI